MASSEISTTEIATTAVPRHVSQRAVYSEPYGEFLVVLPGWSNTILSPFGLIFNIATLIVIWKYKEMRTTANFFVALMAATDTTVCVLLMPLYGLGMLLPYSLDGFLGRETLICAAAGYFLNCLPNMSLMALTATSFNRYVGMFHPLSYKRLFVKPVMIFVALLTITLPWLITLPYYIIGATRTVKTWRGQCVMSLNRSVSTAISVHTLRNWSMIYVPMAFCIVVHVAILLALRKRQARKVAASNSAADAARSEKDERVIKNVRLSAAALTLILIIRGPYSTLNAFGLLRSTTSQAIMLTVLINPAFYFLPNVAQPVRVFINLNVWTLRCETLAYWGLY